MEAIRQREAQNAKVARRRVQHQWLKSMRQAKADELLRDVEILSQAHDRTCDRKDAAIERLARELDTAEEQHRASLRAHTAQLDALNNLQHRLVLEGLWLFDRQAVGLGGVQGTVLAHQIEEVGTVFNLARKPAPERVFDERG